MKRYYALACVVLSAISAGACAGHIMDGDRSESQMLAAVAVAWFGLAMSLFTDRDG